MLQSNQVREVDRKLLIALVSQLTFLRVIGEITLILVSQYAGSKDILLMRCSPWDDRLHLRLCTISMRVRGATIFGPVLFLTILHNTR